MCRPYTASPTSLSFGNELTNVASAPKSVTVTNTGAVALPITSITLSSSGSQPFSQSNNCGSSLAAGAACTINVVFNPASVGAAAATLSVNAGNGAGTQTVALSGTGVVPTYTASPTSLSFGNELTNVASAPKSVTVTNTGVVALPITSISLSSSGSQPFSQTNTCGSSLAAGAASRSMWYLIRPRWERQRRRSASTPAMEPGRRPWRSAAPVSFDLHGLADLALVWQ